MSAGGSEFEDHHSKKYDIFSFEISQPGDQQRQHTSKHGLGIDALSPHTDDVIFPMKNAEGRGSLPSSSSTGGAIGSALGGERTSSDQFIRSASWGDHHHQSPPPPHIVGLFSPSDRSDSFLRSLSLSPRITPTSSYSSINDPSQLSREDDGIQFLLSPRDQFSSSKVSSPQKSPRVYQSEHEEFLSGMGGMELELDMEFDEETMLDRDAIMSPNGSHPSAMLGFPRQHQPYIAGGPDEDSPRVLIHAHSYTAGTYDSQPREMLPTRANTSPALSGAAGLLGDLEGVPCTATFGEHPYGEHPSRTLFVRNINSNVEDDELATLFEAHGPIRSMYTQCKHRGFVMISYYDIRHAKNAMRHLQGKIIRRRKLDIHYSIPKDNPSEKDQNQGTLVIFNLDPSTTNEELKIIFGQYGEIKEIRETPNKKHHKFIEFYDVRDSEKAMKHLNKTEIKGKKIKIEPSRPGGARKNQMNQLALELGGEEELMVQQSSHNGSLSPMPSSGYLTSAAAPSNMPPPMYYQQSFSPTQQMSPSFNGRKATQSPQLNQSYTHLHSLLPSNSRSSSPSPLVSPRSQSTSPSPSPRDIMGSAPTHTPIPIPSSVAAASVPRNGVPFVPISASSAQKDKVDPTRLTIDRLSLVFGDSLSLGGGPATNQSTGPLFQPRQGGSFVRPNVNHNASTASQSVSAESPQTTPRESTAQNPYMSTSAPVNPNSGVPLRWNPDSSASSLRFPVGTVPTLSVGESYISPPSSGSSTPTQSPRINPNNPKALVKSPRGILPSLNALSSSSTGASSASNTATKKGNSHQEDKMQFTLHIDRVKDGIDARTTLMIKNIPNKYSQKMLLAAVDEHHHGHYDFFYLPIDFKNKCNVGYAFINFINFRSIVPFYEEFNNKKWEKFNSEKVCEITYARIQESHATVLTIRFRQVSSDRTFSKQDGTNIGEQKLFPAAMLRSKPSRRDDRLDSDYSPASLP